MPLLDFNDKAVWDSLYRCQPEGQVLHFERAAKSALLGNDHWELLKALDLKAGQSIVIVGGAFGWVAEDWIEAGYGPITVVDNSTYIHVRKAAHARVPIATELPTGPKADWLITEDVLPGLADNEIGQFLAPLRSRAKTVAHWVTVGLRRYDNPNVWAGDARLNWKTLADWKTLVAPDYVVQRGTATVL